MSSKQLQLKTEEINELKSEIEKLNSEVSFFKEKYKVNFDEVVKSTHQQINLIKDREAFTINQNKSLEEKLTNLQVEKDRVIYLQKEESDNLNKNNRILAKLKMETFNNKNMNF